MKGVRLMRLRAPRRTVASVLVLAVSAFPLAPGTGAAVAEPRERPGRGGPAAVAEVSAERLELADEVAAAKYGTAKPVDDPGREREVLDEVAERAAGLGVGPGWATLVFRDQIEANKAVQHGLHARWDAHPEERPAHRPDLGRDVRPELDRITTELLAGLKGTRKIRETGESRETSGNRGGASCGARLAVGSARAASVRRFDGLHTRALVTAVRAVC